MKQHLLLLWHSRIEMININKTNNIKEINNMGRENMLIRSRGLSQDYFKGREHNLYKE